MATLPMKTSKDHPRTRCPSNTVSPERRSKDLSSSYLSEDDNEVKGGAAPHPLPPVTGYIGMHNVCDRTPDQKRKKRIPPPNIPHEFAPPDTDAQVKIGDYSVEGKRPGQIVYNLQLQHPTIHQIAVEVGVAPEPLLFGTRVRLQSKSVMITQDAPSSVGRRQSVRHLETVCGADPPTLPPRAQSPELM